MRLNSFFVKRLMVCYCLMTFLLQGYSQTQEEWLNQKKKQKEYLLKQIAALKTYVKALDKGYDIVKTGLQTISNIKQGDFDLHNAHLGRLERVSPAVAKYKKIAAAVIGYEDLLHTYHFVKKQVMEGAALSQSDKQYVIAVFSGLIGECFSNLELLKSIVSSGKWKLSDDERIRQIDLVYSRVGEILQFSRYFSAEVMRLAVNKTSEMTELQNYKSMIGIKDL